MQGLLCRLVLAAAVGSGCAAAPPVMPQSPTAPAAVATPTAAPTPTPTVSPAPTPTPTGEPTRSPAATASPTAAGGSPSAGCTNGWVEPAADDLLYAEGIEILVGAMGIEGRPLHVHEMRYFTGPEAPWIIEPRREVVYRWYIKARLEDDRDYRGRWLIEKRTDRILGISAVAPYDSKGYSSPDWTGFFGEGPPRQYAGLPGAWYGIPYDFVTGEGDSGQPGLPDEVSACLDGT